MILDRSFSLIIGKLARLHISANILRESVCSALCAERIRTGIWRLVGLTENWNFLPNFLATLDGVGKEGGGLWDNIELTFSVATWLWMAPLMVDKLCIRVCFKFQNKTNRQVNGSLLRLSEVGKKYSKCLNYFFLPITMIKQGYTLPITAHFSPIFDHWSAVISSAGFSNGLGLLNIGIINHEKNEITT